MSFWSLASRSSTATGDWQIILTPQTVREATRGRDGVFGNGLMVQSRGCSTISIAATSPSGRILVSSPKVTATFWYGNVGVFMK